MRTFSRTLLPLLVYAGFCPLGEQCSKKGKHLKTCDTELEARAVVLHHLRVSPYHELDEETATAMAQDCQISSWMQEAAKKTSDEDDSSWWDSKKRKWKDETASSWWGSGSSSGQSWGSGDSSWQSWESGSTSWQPQHDATSPPQQPAQELLLHIVRARAHENQIVLSKIELQACIDSLVRARNSVDSAVSLCGKAQRAFMEEAQCIRQCVEVLQTYQ